MDVVRQPAHEAIPGRYAHAGGWWWWAIRGRQVARRTAAQYASPARIAGNRNAGRTDHLVVRSYDDLKRVVADDEIVVGVLAVPSDAAQRVADDLVGAGVKIIFNYSEALLQVPPDVTVHTSSPAVDLLYALYFYLT